MINMTILIGRLTKDVELKRTNNGKAVTNFTLAVNRQFKTDNGPDADFIQCQAWNKTAEVLEKYTSKGSQIAVTGSIQTRNYDGNDGKKVYVTEVIVNNVQFLDSKRDNAQGVQQYQNNANQAVSSQNSGYNANTVNLAQSFDNSNDVYDIMQDDIEF